MSLSLNQLLASAAASGVEFDRAEAEAWLASAGGEAPPLEADEAHGVFGHRLSLLDFEAADLDRLRRIAAVVRLPSRPPRVETALALAGSLAQSRIQTHPGDCDFFQRVHLRAPTREAAGRLLGALLRNKAADEAGEPGAALTKVQLGSWPADVVQAGVRKRAGSPVAWSPSDVTAGCVVAEDDAGDPVVVWWDEAARDPGWVKLDWIVADPQRDSLVSASNVVDATWEGPDGVVVALDGFLDPAFQEVYLDAEARPLVDGLLQWASPDALEAYAHAMEAEVRRHLREPANFGKAAKRMYNLFRITGRHLEAAFLRELFDEPTVALYGVWSLLKTVDEARELGAVGRQRLLDEVDRTVLQAVRALDGDDEQEVVRLLLQLKTVLALPDDGAAWARDLAATRDRVLAAVNGFFYERLTALPTLRDYVEAARTAPPT